MESTSSSSIITDNEVGGAGIHVSSSESRNSPLVALRNLFSPGHICSSGIDIWSVIVELELVDSIVFAVVEVGGN